MLSCVPWHMRKNVMNCTYSCFPIFNLLIIFFYFHHFFLILSFYMFLDEELNTIIHFNFFFIKLYLSVKKNCEVGLMVNLICKKEFGLIVCEKIKFMGPKLTSRQKKIRLLKKFYVERFFNNFYLKNFVNFVFGPFSLIF
jgi:hypothetical protein